MRLRMLFPAALLVAGAAQAGAAQSAADSLRAMDSAWARTYATHDTVLAAALLADRLVMTTTDGRLKDKAAELGDVRPTPGLTLHHFRTSEVRVDLYPGAGVVTGLADWAFTYNGRDQANRRRYTAVYVRGGPLGWQMVALHIGRAPEAPAAGGR